MDRQRITIRGSSAALYWAYQRVASLGAWTFADGRLEAVIESIDERGIRASALELRIPWQGRTHRRIVTGIARSPNGRIVVTVGPKLETGTA